MNISYMTPEEEAIIDKMIDQSQLGSALDMQVDGNHYQKLKIQPWVYIEENKLGFTEGSVIKYVTRWKDKNGLKDLKKARHFLDMLIEKESENER